MFGIADSGACVAAIVVFLMVPGPGRLALTHLFPLLVDPARANRRVAHALEKRARLLLVGFGIQLANQ